MIGLTKDGRPHIRLEHRVPAAGPSIVDVIANIAFFLGLMAYYGKEGTPLECEIPFCDSKENFYRAAKHGIQANVKWTGGQSISLLAVLEQSLLPNAKKGLKMAGLRTHRILPIIWMTLWATGSKPGKMVLPGRGLLPLNMGWISRK